MIRAISVTILCALPPLVPAGCTTIEGTYGFPPFYEVYPNPSRDVKKTGEEILVRPLFASETFEGDSRRVWSYPPFFSFQWEPDGRRYRVLPIYHYRSFRHPLGEDDVDWFLLPFFGGRDPEEGRYFAVFPLGGTIKGLLGHDDIHFALFPLYWYWTTEERKSVHILWPFYNRVWDGDWSGWRLWPFYGRYRSHTEEGRPRYDRGFVLWPFYIRRRDRLHDDPTDFFFTFPFYGSNVNSRVDARTYLWPLYQKHHDKKRDRTLHMGFFPPYRITEGQTDIWPFYGVKRTSRIVSLGEEERRRHRQYCLWPIQRYDWATDESEEMTRFWLLPLLWHFYYIDKDTFQTREFWKVWPLFRYRRAEGEVAFDLVSPLWIDREEYDRFYSRWFGIFRYRRRPDASGWEVLYGALTFRRRHTEPGDEGKSPQDEEALFTVLGGLFECGSRKGGIVLRLLYIPWW